MVRLLHAKPGLNSEVSIGRVALREQQRAQLAQSIR
jgi:hypothetical protein